MLGQIDDNDEIDVIRKTKDMIDPAIIHDIYRIYGNPSLDNQLVIIKKNNKLLYDKLSSTRDSDIIKCAVLQIMKL